MKYIDAEKLIAEIERLKERAQAERVLHPQTILSAKNYLLIKDYDNLLSIITSLQQEQPEVNIWHDVKKEAPTNFGAEIIVLCKNKNKEDGIWLADVIQCFEGEYKPRENWEDPVKWAYLSEILPQRD